MVPVRSAHRKVLFASAKDFLAAEYRNHWHDDCGMAGGREGLHVLFPDAWPRNAMLSSTPHKALGMMYMFVRRKN